MTFVTLFSITAASVIDDSELSELLRQDANQQRQERAARVGAPMANDPARASGQPVRPIGAAQGGNMGGGNMGGGGMQPRPMNPVQG